VEVVEAAQVVPQLQGADLDDERGGSATGSW
jgi:hypothetical protein